MQSGLTIYFFLHKSFMNASYRWITLLLIRERVVNIQWLSRVLLYYYLFHQIVKGIQVLAITHHLGHLIRRLGRV